MEESRLSNRKYNDWQLAGGLRSIPGKTADFFLVTASGQSVRPNQRTAGTLSPGVKRPERKVCAKVYIVLLSWCIGIAID